MNITEYDTKAARIFRAAIRPSGRPDGLRTLQGDLDRNLRDAPRDVAAILNRAFEAVRRYPFEASRLSSLDYVHMVRQLLDGGCIESASALCTACIGSLASLDLDIVSRAIPSPACFDSWLTAARGDKARTIKTIAASRDSYYSTSLCDWLVRKSTVKGLLPLAQLTLEGRPRPSYLPSSEELLRSILTRDRSCVLAQAVVAAALIDRDRLRRLVVVSSRVPYASEAYARAFGTALVKEDAVALVPNLAAALGSLLTERGEAFASYAQFTAHIATTFCLSPGGNSSARDTTTAVLLRLGSGVFLSGQDTRLRDSDVWFACTTGAIHQQVLPGSAKISPQGALQVALAVRASQSGASEVDSLSAAAVNLGLGELEEVGSVVTFDPNSHEDLEGGMLPGAAVRVVRCGWVFEGRVLLRAQVQESQSGDR